MPVGHPFDNIAYGSASWREQEDSEKYYRSDLTFSSTLPNEVRVNVGSRAYIKGHHILFESTESVLLPSSVLSETTFYFYVTADNENKIYSALQFSTTLPIANNYTGLQDLLLGRLIVPTGAVSLVPSEIFNYYAEVSRVIRLQETGILDSDFSGLIFDQAINLIASNSLKPFILEDQIDTNYYPILNQIFRDRFQNSSAVYSIEYRCTSIGNPGNLVITPNQSTNEFRLKTDNYVTPITKYGDFCKEKTNLSVLQAENVGKYIEKLQDPTSQTITMKFIGDSLTRGFDSVNGSPTTYVGDDGTTRTDTLVVDIAYPEKVETTFEVMYPQHVINHINNGWSGGNIGDINTHYFADNGEDICVIMIGTNDSSANPSTIKEFREGLMQQIELRLSQGSAVVLVQPIQKLERRGYAIKPFKAEIKKIAEEYNLGLIDGQEMLSNSDYEKYSDAVHLNQDGYNLFGIKMACALSTDGVLTSFRKFKSGEFFPFMAEEIFYGGDRLVGYGQFFPNLQIKDVGGGTYGGTSKFIQPGEPLSIPIYLSERNMYIIPQIYRDTIADAGDISFNLNFNIAESFSNFYLTSVDGTNYQFGVDGKYNTSARVLLEGDFSAGGVTSLANYIETSSITNKFICSPSKGWCLLTLYNNSTVSYVVHGIDIISSFDYQGITGKKLMSRVNPITLV